MIGSVYEPVGIPFLYVEVPIGKTIKSVDVDATPNVVIYEDIHKSEIEILKDKVNCLTLALAEMMGE